MFDTLGLEECFDCFCPYSERQLAPKQHWISIVWPRWVIF